MSNWPELQKNPEQSENIKIDAETAQKWWKMLDDVMKWPDKITLPPENWNKNIGEFITVGKDLYVVTKINKNISYDKDPNWQKFSVNPRFEYYMADTNDAEWSNTRVESGTLEQKLDIFAQWEVNKLIADPTTDWDNMSISIRGWASNIRYGNNEKLPEERANHMKDAFIKFWPKEKPLPIFIINIEQSKIAWPAYPPTKEDINTRFSTLDKTYNYSKDPSFVSNLQKLGGLNTIVDNANKELTGGNSKGQNFLFLEKYLYRPFQFSDATISYTKLTEHTTYEYVAEKAADISKILAADLALHSVFSLYAKNPNYGKSDLDPKFPAAYHQYMYMQINPDRAGKWRSGTGYWQWNMQGNTLPGWTNPKSRGSASGFLGDYSENIKTVIDNWNYNTNYPKDMLYTQLNKHAGKDAWNFKAYLSDADVAAFTETHMKNVGNGWYNKEYIGYPKATDNKNKPYEFDRSEFDAAKSSTTDPVQLGENLGKTKYVQFIENLVTNNMSNNTRLTWNSLDKYLLAINK